MKDPVMLADDGYTYEREAIIKWYKNLNNKTTPFGEEIDERPPDLMSDKKLKKKIAKYLSQNKS